MKTIFMAEDDSFVVKIFAKVFNLEGFDFIVAEDGQKAKDALLGNKITPALFLLDVMMPGMSGFELLEFIKTQDRLKDIPVIFFTNLYSAEDEKKAIGMGAKLYLVKSDNYPKEVVDKVKNILNITK